MRLTNDADNVRMPLRSELKKKHDQIKVARDRAMTNVSPLHLGREKESVDILELGGDPASN